MKPKERWKNGNGYKKQKRFYNAKNLTNPAKYVILKELVINQLKEEALPVCHGLRGLFLTPQVTPLVRLCTTIQDNNQLPKTSKSLETTGKWRSLI